MKIAILTLPLHTNYGGILQAWALQQTLRRLGHDPIVLQKVRAERSRWLMPLVYAKRGLLKSLGLSKGEVFAERIAMRTQNTIRQHTDVFIRKHLTLLPFKSFQEIKQGQFDAYVVGSDQVWRARYFGPNLGLNITDAYLKFASNWDVRRVAYAPSFGLDNLDEYNEEEIRQCGALLRKFDAVSARERSGVEICRDYFDVDAQHVIDPTLLMDRSDYEALLDGINTPKSPGNMLCYILDPSEQKQQIVNEIAQHRGLTPFSIGADVHNGSLTAEERIQPPLEQWLRGFIDAEYVVTDSFHACVFSIIFHKPFIAIDNAKRGMARLQSLFDTFGLENRLVNPDGPCLPEDPDFDAIDAILAAKRQEAMNFLKNSL